MLALQKGEFRIDWSLIAGKHTVSKTENKRSNPLTTVSQPQNRARVLKCKSTFVVIVEKCSVEYKSQ